MYYKDIIEIIQIKDDGTILYGNGSWPEFTVSQLDQDINWFILSILTGNGKDFPIHNLRTGIMK